MTELVHSASGSQGRAGTLSHVASASGRTGKIIMAIKLGGSQWGGVPLTVDG